MKIILQHHHLNFVMNQNLKTISYHHLLNLVMIIKSKLSRYERKKEPHGYIANTDPLDRPGHHWLVLWTHSGNVVEVMDICALQNNRATARLVKRSIIICDLKRTVFAIDLQFSNICLTVPCCFYSIVFGNF